MNLSDYISLTLSEIAKGVQKANRPYAKKDKDFVLSETSFKIEGIPSIHLDGEYKPIINVGFRVGIEVEESEKSKCKLGGSLKVVSANYKSSSTDGRRSLHEVSFELPLILP